MIKQIGTPIKIKIRKGDSLSKIAKANNTTIDAIKALNPQIKDINKIKIGDEVILSAPPKKVEEKATNPFNQSFHVIQKGDNPTLIARKYKMSLKDLMELNPKLNPKKLFVGQRLYLRKEAAKADLDLFSKNAKQYYEDNFKKELFFENLLKELNELLDKK